MPVRIQRGACYSVALSQTGICFHKMKHRLNEARAGIKGRQWTPANSQISGPSTHFQRRSSKAICVRQEIVVIYLCALGTCLTCPWLFLSSLHLLNRLLTKSHTAIRIKPQFTYSFFWSPQKGFKLLFFLHIVLPKTCKHKLAE